MWSIRQELQSDARGVWKRQIFGVDEQIEPFHFSWFFRIHDFIFRKKSEFVPRRHSAWGVLYDLTEFAGELDNATKMRFFIVVWSRQSAVNRNPCGVVWHCAVAFLELRWRCWSWERFSASVYYLICVTQSIQMEWKLISCCLLFSFNSDSSSELAIAVGEI